MQHPYKLVVTATPNRNDCWITATQSHSGNMTLLDAKKSTIGCHWLSRCPPPTRHQSFHCIEVPPKVHPSATAVLIWG